jgi:hypothetical protein
MSESFWFMTGEDDESAVPVDHAPFQEPMRGDRRLTNAPSTDQKKVRRQIHRSGSWFSEDDDDYRERHAEKWKGYLNQMDGIHRGVGLHLPPKLHNFVHDETKPVHERADALLSHLSDERGNHNNGMRDRRQGLGPHWTSSPGVAEGFAEEDAQYRANQSHPADDPKDFTWGRSKGEWDEDKLHDHLRDHHGLPESRLGEHSKLWVPAHERLHKGPAEIAGQQPLFHADHDHTHLDSFRDPDVAHGQPATAVVLHAHNPSHHDITDEGEGEGGMIYEWGTHGENEVPLQKGAEVGVKGISWAKVHSDDSPDKPWLNEYTHHDFDEPQTHHASRTATVLNTQVERLNKGDSVRTPTGQSSVVKGVRPHETDSTLMYMDTDQGTSTVKRGTDFQVVPHNSQQQELPDIGNPMNAGNSGQSPAAGHGAGGPSAPAGSGGTPNQCPNCGNSGTMRMHSGSYVCGVCGFTVSAGGSPGGLLFGNQEHGYSPGRRKPGEVPKAHVWASKYTAQTESQFASRFRQAALGGDK